MTDGETMNWQDKARKLAKEMVEGNLVGTDFALHVKRIAEEHPQVLEATIAFQVGIYWERINLSYYSQKERS